MSHRLHPRAIELVTRATVVICHDIEIICPHGFIRPNGVPSGPKAKKQSAVTDLYWLPHLPDWRARLDAWKDCARRDPRWGSQWDDGVALARARLGFPLISALDQVLCGNLSAGLGGQPDRAIRLAVLSSSPISHLLASIRVGALRHGLPLETHETGWGRFRQALSDAADKLHAFAPDFVLVALDARHLTAGVAVDATARDADAALAAVLADVRAIWRMVRDRFGCPILQQAILPVHLPLLGANEHRFPGSPAYFVVRLNAVLRIAADEEQVDILAIDDRAARDGIARWHDPGLWHHARQEVRLTAAPFYGELVARWLAARRGRSRKCLVLDLDNTIWGGVVGDDGLNGIVLGQGSALGEAFLAVQRHAKALASRGVVLAVCSKNDEAVALAPFERHPEMALRRDDIACFVANWSDKPTNLRAIARSLNIGLDSLVLLDDNPFERNLVRDVLPMVAVPELDDDPACYPATLADAGYFEGLSVTEEDRTRGAQYQGNLARSALMDTSTDLPAYLRGLGMVMTARRFDRAGLPRIVQLSHKSNQFNLTTRRLSEQDVQSVIDDPRAIGLQLRLEDRFGDNGMIALVIGRLQSGQCLLIDTWLMSCRVLGRQVEAATLNLLVEHASRLGASHVIGEFRATCRNEMVRDHYTRLGFTPMAATEPGASRAVLCIAGYRPLPTFIRVMET